jgi:hypothetical protein
MRHLLREHTMPAGKVMQTPRSPEFPAVTRSRIDLLYARWRRSAREMNSGTILEESCMTTGIASRYSPIRGRSSHWRKSPLEALLWATWKLDLLAGLSGALAD